MCVNACARAWGKIESYGTQFSTRQLRQEIAYLRTVNVSFDT